VAKKRLIAIVDDEPDISKLYYDFLSKIKGISIFTFTDPFSAIEHIRVNKNSYVLVMSDLRMPDLSGLELVKIIKDLNPSIRTILMTAFSIKDDLFQEYTSQEIINDFLQKPILFPDLYERVRKQLRKHKLKKRALS
jgi:DNA-binding NtrC family response regulator